MAKVQRVRITLDVDAQFIRLLQAHAQISGITHDDKRLAVSEVLTLVALGEMRGMTETQIHLKTPPEWRGNIEAVHSERKWQDEEGKWHRTGDGS